MTRRSLQFDLPIFYLRHLPIEAVGAAARAIESSGVVDSVTVWDQLTFHVPPALWTTEHTPLAAEIPDLDSMPDAFATLGYVAAIAPKLGLTTSPDAARRGPGELMQSMLTLSDMSHGRATFQMGAGEIKQTGPFGHKTNQGLKRLEDQLRIYRRFLQNDGPIDHEGNVWTMNQAWLGGSYQYRPRLFALGGGPKLIDLATSYADGFSTMAPCVWRDPETAAEQIAEMKQTLERKGRDPESFTFGIWVAAMLHDDDAVIERSLASPVIQWMTATWGRINQADWEKEGIASPMPHDWHYARDSLPVSYSASEALEICSRVTPEMGRKAWMCGDARTIADRIQGYIDAGVTFIHVGDLLPMTLPLAEAPAAQDRALDIAAHIKQRNPSTQRRSL